MDSLYDKIAALCDARGIKPGRMARDLEMSRGSMSDLKMGRVKSFGLPLLSKIADYFNVPIDYFAESSQSIPSPDKEKGPVYDDEANEMMREMYERPELKALFKTTKGAKPEDIEFVDEMLKKFKEGYRDD